MVDIAARVTPVFPANVYGQQGVTVTKVNGAFYLGYDYDVYWSTKGDILVRGEINPEALTAGPNGFVLTSNGPGEIPSYQPIEIASIPDGSLTEPKYGTESVSTRALADGSVTEAKLDSSAVTTNKVADGAITPAKLEPQTQGEVPYYGASGAYSLLPPGTSGQVLQTNGAGANPSWVTPGGGSSLPSPGGVDTLLYSDGAAWQAGGIPTSLPRSTSVGGVPSITLTTAYAYSQCTVDTYNGGVNSQQEIIVTLPSASASGQGAIIQFLKSQAGPSGSDHPGLMTITDGSSFTNTTSLPGSVQVYRSNGASWSLIWPSLKDVRGSDIQSHRTVSTTPYTTALKDMQWGLRVITDATGINGNGTVNLPAPTSLSIGYLGWTTYITNVAGATGNTVIIDAGAGQSINRAGQTYTLTEDWQTVKIYTDGSEWYVLTDTNKNASLAEVRAGTISNKNVTPKTLEGANGPRFQATRTAAFVPTVNTWTKVPVNAEDFDSDNAYDPTTNYRFQPQVAGWYMVWISGSVNANDGAVTGIRFYKNGSPDLAMTALPGAAGAVNLQGFKVMQFNGTSDYLEMWCYSSNTGSPSISNSLFGGYRLF